MSEKENRKLLIGRVVSDKMAKTVVVEVESQRAHRLYHRVVRTSRRFKAHDEQEVCHVGDVVQIEESRPLSKEKRWRVRQIVQHRQVAELQPRDIGVVEGAES